MAGSDVPGVGSGEGAGSSTTCSSSISTCYWGRVLGRTMVRCLRRALEMLAAAGGMKSQPHHAAFIGGSRIKMLERVNQSAHSIFPPKTPPRVSRRAPRGLATPTPGAPPAPRDHVLRTSLPSRHHTVCAPRNTAQPPRASGLPRQNRDSHGIAAVAPRPERCLLKHRRGLAACRRCCREVRHRCHTATKF